MRSIAVSIRRTGKASRPGQQPRGWAELRKYGFEGLWAPIQSIELLIDTFEWKGDTAVLTGRLRTVGMKGKWVRAAEGDVEEDGDGMEAANPPEIPAG